MGLPRQEYWSGIFPPQGLNLHLLHCRQILYLSATWEARALLFSPYQLDELIKLFPPVLYL